MIGCTPMKYGWTVLLYRQPLWAKTFCLSTYSILAIHPFGMGKTFDYAPTQFGYTHNEFMHPPSFISYYILMKCLAIHPNNMDKTFGRTSAQYWQHLTVTQRVWQNVLAMQLLGTGETFCYIVTHYRHCLLYTSRCV